MNNELKDEYTNEGDREEQIKEEKINKFQKGFVIFVLIFIIIIMVFVMYNIIKANIR